MVGFVDRARLWVHEKHSTETLGLVQKPLCVESLPLPFFAEENNLWSSFLFSTIELIIRVLFPNNPT